jgi:hypothetical protein
MKNIKTLLTAVAILFSAQFAQGNVEAPIWDCSLSFDVQGGGVKILIGKYKLRGEGEINCIDIDGNTQSIPALVTIGLSPLSPKIALGKMHLVGWATGVGLAQSPYDLFGNYLVGNVTGSFFVGAGADVALHGTNKALTLNAAVQAVSGFGVDIGLDHMIVEPMGLY